MNTLSVEHVTLKVPKKQHIDIFPPTYRGLTHLVVTSVSDSQSEQRSFKYFNLKGDLRLKYLSDIEKLEFASLKMKWGTCNHTKIISGISSEVLEKYGM